MANPIDTAESLLERGASVGDASRTLAEALGLSQEAARYHVLQALERQAQESILLRSVGLDAELRALWDLAQGPDLFVASQALAARLRALGAFDGDVAYRLARTRAAQARATSAAVEAARKPEQLSLDLRARAAGAIEAEVSARTAQRMAGEDAVDPAAGFWDPAKEPVASE